VHTVPTLSIKKCCKIGSSYAENEEKCVPATSAVKIDIIYVYDYEPHNKVKKMQFDQLQVVDLKIKTFADFGR
jgi:hypothetical protein